jgi:hypothetical protein
VMRMGFHDELVSRREFGRRHRLSHVRVQKLVADGLPTKDGKVRAKAAAAWLKRNLDHARKNNWRATDGRSAERRHGDHNVSLAELRRQLAQQKVEVGRIEIAKASGELIERAVVKRFITERAQMERDAWLAWSSATSARLAAELAVDTGRLFGLLESEVRAHLRALSDKPLEGAE